MSFISGINEPKDMLLKLVREGNRVNFEQNAEDVMDHFFNFSVTAHALRDWCINYLSQHQNKKQLNKIWDNEKHLVIAKDIANSVKHFKITMYTPDVKEASSSTAQSITFFSNENIEEKMEKAQKSKEYRESQTQESPSFIVTFTDGETEKLTDYVLKTIKFWVDYFDRNSIPRYTIDQNNIFLNRHFWGVPK
ncbi:hypothetical protein MSP8886_01493 [Marinomonas spartinae]|uniref:Uncharacterized protein n=1 Tax=Marinomonas spartinae TaxID=1792290 RepID=A0A1A8T9T9_9GAMM|nr:hypothetical protein [Marinomonas spartinae]SBS29256.1 hypothetical protein MSP8886_01493 [Marinomonas spartinae]